MRKLTALLTLGTLGLAAAASAQEAFGANGQYAQFRNLSGLPGGTFGVSRNGLPDSRGAMAISTPIAYSLKGGSFSATLANTSYDSHFRALTKVKQNDFGWSSNGTATAMAGISTGMGDFTIGMTVVSGAFENSYSAMYTPSGQKGRFTFGFGAEGIFSGGGFLGPGFHSNADRVISAFSVVTCELDNDIYVSAGIGTSRFSQGFFNASAGLTKTIRATVEHDGFGWNYGVGMEIGRVKVGQNRAIKLNTFVGMIQTRYAFWSVGLSF